MTDTRCVARGKGNNTRERMKTKEKGEIRDMEKRESEITVMEAKW